MEVNFNNLSHFNKAIELLGFAFMLRKSINSSVDLVDILAHEKNIKLLKDKLGESEYDILYARGKKMILDDFILAIEQNN